MDSLIYKNQTIAVEGRQFIGDILVNNELVDSGLKIKILLVLQDWFLQGFSLYFLRITLITP